MLEPLLLLISFLLAAVPSIAACRVVMALRVLDGPTEPRKTQVVAVPTAGGVGFGLAAIFAVQWLSEWRPDFDVLAIEAGGVGALMIGFYDDRFHLAALVKLVLLVAVCAGLTAFGIRADAIEPWPGANLDLGVLGGAAGSLLWLLVLANAVNFMDGANGLSMGMAAIAAVGLCICSALAGEFGLALMAAALSGALAGFLVWNIPGRLFAGDAGALFSGVTLGAISLALVSARPDWVLIPAIAMLPWLTDVLLTLIWRARHRKPLFSAHRDHSYQIALKAGMKHWQVSLVHAVWALNAAIVAVVASMVGGYMPVIAFLALLGISIWIHQRVRREGERAGLVGADIA
ncbi:MAG: glycosyl transferase [Alphaproteobacteria bacterium]|nr:glycosyl transferase [Alphaproteobacteria bacterium]